MKGARALMSGTLVLALCCAIPAISVAQDAGTTTDATTTTTATTPESTPPPVDPADGPAGQDNPQDGGNSKDRGGASNADKGDGSQSTPPTPAQAQPAAPSTAAAAASAPKAHKSASASVTMGDLFFSPTSVTIAVGDTVTWRNTGDAPHNATADDGSFATPTINNGQSASHTFSQAGTFSYTCTIHPQMKGTVRVLASDTGGGGGGGNASSSSGSSTSESSAVASPGAAGDGNTLPMTGLAAGALALVGFAMLGCGLLVRFWGRRASGSRRQLTLF